jgi:hypothetical protein
MKLILDIDNPNRKYTYNAYSAHEYEDGTVSEDARKVESDDLQKFVNGLIQLMIKPQS